MEHGKQYKQLEILWGGGPGFTLSRGKPTYELQTLLW